MIKAKLFAFLLLLFCTSVYAAEIKPSHKSIDELLQVMESKRMMDSSLVQVENYLKATIQQAFQGQALTEQQQKEIDAILSRMLTLLKQDITWEKLEPMFVKVYRDSFSQQEVDGMLAFYKSPSGQAVIRKMPVVMQNTMAEMQKIMGPIMQKVVKMEQEEIAQIKTKESMQQ